MSEILIKFKSAGASSVAGSLMFRGQEVATMRHGVVILTPAGEDALRHLNAKAEAMDVVVKPASDVGHALQAAPTAVPRSPRPPKTKTKAAATSAPVSPEIPAAPTPAPAPVTTDLADLLNDET